MLRMTSDLRLDQCQEPGNSIGVVGLGEDMRPVDVMTTCTIDECARGLGELVKFQAPLWNSRTMPELQRVADPRRTIGVLDAPPVGWPRDDRRRRLEQWHRGSDARRRRRLAPAQARPYLRQPDLGGRRHR